MKSQDNGNSKIVELKLNDTKMMGMTNILIRELGSERNQNPEYER